jgi:drug/metabolite transporter (DMT)-like permease
MDYVQPMTFQSIRFLIGGFVLFCYLHIFHRRKMSQKGKKDTMIAGFCCGTALCISSWLQQYGLLTVDPGKVGFITALYVIMVPLFGMVRGKKVDRTIWGSVCLAVVGMYLLCVSSGTAVQKTVAGFPISTGEILAFLAAVGFTFHILTIDYFVPKVDGVTLSMTQFFVAGIFSLIGLIGWEHPTLSSIVSAKIPLLYTGILSCGVAYTLQITAQKHLSPVVACLILSLESVFSVLAGWLLLGDRLSLKELSGCVLVFTAILLAQIPETVWRGGFQKIIGKKNGKLIREE